MYNADFENALELGLALEAAKENIRVKNKEVDDQGRISVGADLAGEKVTAIVHENTGEN